MGIIAEIKKKMADDPLYKCKLYNEIGCSHVDGMLCDYPNCTMLKDYLTNEVNTKQGERNEQS